MESPEVLLNGSELEKNTGSSSKIVGHIGLSQLDMVYIYIYINICMRVLYIHSNIVINMCICICNIREHSIVCTKFSPFWIKIRIFGRILFSKKERTLGIKFNSCQMAALPFCEFQVSINLWKLPPGPPRSFDITCTIYILKTINHYSVSVMAYLSKPCPTSAPKILQMLVSYFLPNSPNSQFGRTCTCLCVSELEFSMNPFRSACSKMRILLKAHGMPSMSYLLQKETSFCWKPTILWSSAYDRVWWDTKVICMVLRDQETRATKKIVSTCDTRGIMEIDALSKRYKS